MIPRHQHPVGTLQRLGTLLLLFAALVLSVPGAAAPTSSFTESSEETELEGVETDPPSEADDDGGASDPPTPGRIHAGALRPPRQALRPQRIAPVPTTSPRPRPWTGPTGSPRGPPER